MPRQPRLRLAGASFHVIQRGNNRAPCFFREADYRRYLDELRAQSVAHEVDVHAYVLMTNHVHLLLTPRQADGLERMMKPLGQFYVQYINFVHDRCGSLWQGRFHACLVDSEDYLLTCHRYIECNPVRAGLARDPGDYPWSSYRANAFGEEDTLLTAHPCVAALGEGAAERHAAYRELFTGHLSCELLDEIRGAINGGYVLGTPSFKARVAHATGRRVDKRRRGPRPRKSLGSDPK